MILICDWHGTFVVDDYQRRLLKSLGIYHLRRNMLSFPIRSCIDFVHGRRLCRVDRDGGDIQQLTSNFNHYFVNHMSLEWIKSRVSRFAEANAARIQINHAVADALTAEQHRFETRVLLTSGLVGYISSILSIWNLSSLFTDIVGNDFREDQGVTKLDLKVYQNKAIVAQRYLALGDQAVLSVGNDYFDRELLMRSTYRAVSNLASNEFRHEFRKVERTSVIDNAADFRDFIKKIC